MTAYDGDNGKGTVKDEKVVTKRCVSKKLEKVGGIFPCENKGEEVGLNSKKKDAIEVFAKPKAAGASVF